jgi:hypothetical protein
VSIVDVNGKPFISAEADIQGHVFLTDSWQKGNIQLNNGTVARGLRIKLNLLNNYLHFLNDRNVEMYKEANEIKMIEIVNEINNDSVMQIFKTYESQKNGKKTTAFYEQLTTGNIVLLKLTSKKIVVSKNEFTKEISKEFVQYDEYYIYKKDEIKQLKRKQSFFEELMNDKWKLIDKFIEQDNLTFKSISNIRAIINFYNSIL